MAFSPNLGSPTSLEMTELNETIENTQDICPPNQRRLYELRSERKKKVGGRIPLYLTPMLPTLPTFSIVRQNIPGLVLTGRDDTVTQNTSTMI